MHSFTEELEKDLTYGHVIYEILEKIDTEEKNKSDNFFKNNYTYFNYNKIKYEVE